MGEETRNEVTAIQQHMSTIEKGDVLDIIQEKEMEINTKVLETRKQAENVLAEARRKAVEIKEKASAEGPKEAKVYYDAQMAKAKKEAAKVESSAESEVEQVTTEGMNSFNKAVSKVEDLVIP